MSNVKAMDPNAQMNWVPKIDRELPVEEQLTIIYRPLKMSEEAEISDNQISQIQKGRKSQYKYLVSQADIKRITKAIVDWKNLEYPEGHESAGKPVPYCKENIELIPPEVRTEFVTFLTGRDRISDDEDDDLGEAETA